MLGKFKKLYFKIFFIISYKIQYRSSYEKILLDKLKHLKLFTHTSSPK